MMKNSKLKFSEYMQNISGSKRFSRFVLIVYKIEIDYSKYFLSGSEDRYLDIV